MSEASVITEEMRKLIGVEMGPEVYEVEKSMIRKLAEAIDDPNPLWQDEAYGKKTRYGSIIAPPTFICPLRLMEPQEMIERLTAAGSPLSRLLHGGSELEYYQVIKPGDVISVTGKFTEFREREGKSGKMAFFILELDYKNQKGELAARCRNTFVLR